MRPLARGFTLLELMVALGMAAVIISAAVGVFLAANRAALEAAARAQLSRDGQLVIDYLKRDLSFAGVGVPTAGPPEAGVCKDNACATLPMGATIRVGQPTSLVFIGDQPYPNSELAGIVSISRFGTNTSPSASDVVAVTSELSGPCTPPNSSASSAFQCKTSVATLMPGSFTTADNCGSGNETKRTCPWALNKWQGGLPTQLEAVDGGGRWYPRNWSGVFADVGDNRGVALNGATIAPLPRDPFVVPFGSGWIAQLDRVFYAVEAAGGGACTATDCVVRRRQCWGAFNDPTAASFPAVGGAAVGLATTPATCGVPAEGTGWETIVTGVETMTFAYFGAGGAALGAITAGNASQVRAVEVDLTLSRKITDRAAPLLHHVRNRIFLQNRDTP